MILNMYSIYIEYLNQANKANKKSKKIYICALKLVQKLHISNKKREQAVSFLEQQTVKVKCYKKMIDALQGLVSTKPDKLLSSIEKPIISTAQHLYIHYYPQLIANHPVKINIKHAICILEVMTVFLDLGNSQRPYQISQSLSMEKIYLQTNNCLKCKGNLKSTNIIT